MATGATIVTQIIRKYNLQNVRTINANRPNPYDKNSQITASPKDRQLYMSSLGTPVFTDLTFESVRYDAGRRISPKITLVTVLMQVSQPKTVTTTALQGRNSTVKEYIGMGDYEITINGIITGTNGRYPREAVHDFKQMLNAPLAIPVVSWYLQNLDIHYLVIKDYSFDQEPGGISQQNFSMTCLSDNPTDLLITL